MICIFRVESNETDGRVTYRSRRVEAEFYAETTDLCPDCSTPSMDIEFDDESATAHGVAHDETCPVMQGVGVEDREVHRL